MLAVLLGQIDSRDVTMVMDADSVIALRFLEVAMDRLESDPDLIAVGGVFTGEPGSGLVGQLQRNEYTRYQRYIARRRGRVFVLTGTASLFRSYALKAVALWRQRMRWQRGALENISAYGPTTSTFRYWMQQLGIGYGVIALGSYLVLLTITVLSADEFAPLLFWLAIGLIFVVERVVTAWPAGWKGRLIALPLVIELAYAVLLQAVYVVSLVEIASGRAAGWNYVPRQEARNEEVLTE